MKVNVFEVFTNLLAICAVLNCGELICRRRKQHFTWRCRGNFVSRGSPAFNWKRLSFIGGVINNIFFNWTCQLDDNLQLFEWGKEKKNTRKHFNYNSVIFSPCTLSVHHATFEWRLNSTLSPLNLNGLQEISWDSSWRLCLRVQTLNVVSAFVFCLFFFRNISSFRRWRWRRYQKNFKWPWKIISFIRNWSFIRNQFG